METNHILALIGQCEIISDLLLDFPLRIVKKNRFVSIFLKVVFPKELVFSYSF